MTFPELNAKVGSLSEGLRVHVDRAAVAAVNTRPPESFDDEVGFLRLTTWSYTLVFEAGRTSFKLLLSMPPLGGDVAVRDRHSATVVAVQQLRTWLHHNLGFDTDRDMSIRRSVSDWFIQACGATAPIATDQWGRCFSKLCGDMDALVCYCHATLSAIMASAEDREETLATWRRRLLRDWPAHKFDELASDAAERLGLSLNVRAIRERHISDWRRHLESVPEDDDPVPHMERVIDQDIYDHQRSAPPLGARELISALGISPGPIVGHAMRFLRDAVEEGIRGNGNLIDYVKGRLERGLDDAN
jgi:hypothetical protein